MKESLDRYVEAQRSVYTKALEELRAGRKHSHWIWFIFPQMHGLGTSDMSIRYGIHSEAEARAYLDHPVLGQRYIECVEAVYHWIVLRQKPIADLMGGELDALKLRSSLELFSRSSSPGSKLAALAQAVLSCDPKP